MIDQIRSNLFHMVQMTTGITHSAPTITKTGVKIYTDQPINLHGYTNMTLISRMIKKINLLLPMKWTNTTGTKKHIMKKKTG